MLPVEALQKRIGNSELGRQWMNEPLMNQDIWPLEKLGYSQEECKLFGQNNIYFDKIFLPWLRLLTKLTTREMARKKYSLSTVCNKIKHLKQLDEFLRAKGYIRPELITDTLLKEFTSSKSSGNKQTTIIYALKLWAEEQWLKLPYTPHKYKRKTPSIKIVPEEVLHQIYEKFDLFPPPLERLFRLQLALGCRIGEMLKMPRQCLKEEDGKWFLLRWVEKRKHWKFYQVHSAVVDLVREQQRFLDTQFGLDSDFDKLFCKVSTSNQDGASQGKRFEIEPIYLPELLANPVISPWLRDFSEKAELKDKHGLRFNLSSHQFRRTKASVMAYCEAEDEYIAAVLGNGSLDMLPHYRKCSLEKLEKEAKAKGYVDMYGRVTGFKPRKRRYERLAELLKVNTPLGECHRPTMLGDCQYRYACLSCAHHRVTLEDQPKLETDIQRLEKDLKEAQIRGQERRVTEIKRLLELLKTRWQGLEKLENLKEKEINEYS